MNDRAVLLAAGGTGGHLFPAEALAHALQKRGVPVELVSDNRALKFGADFPARAVHSVASATPSSGSMFAKLSAGLTLARGLMQARRLVRKIQPLAVVGFGGYPTVPLLLAAAQCNIPVILHEQNAVMGRANRFLSARANAIATGFPDLTGFDARIQSKLTHVGNPLRPMVLEAAALHSPGFDDGILRLLVTGGSQGARVMSDIVPVGVSQLPPEARARLFVTQQARPEDCERVIAAYKAAGVAREVAAFFKDLPLRIAQSHLVIGRAGASTVSELAAIGRACILVPLPGSLDQDQAGNAEVLAKPGAADVILQNDFSPDAVADLLREALDQPEVLTERGEAAKTVGVLDAADRLASLVMRVANIQVGTNK